VAEAQTKPAAHPDAMNRPFRYLNQAARRLVRVPALAGLADAALVAASPVRPARQAVGLTRARILARYLTLW
jgi:hypothetical protein